MLNKVLSLFICISFTIAYTETSEVEVLNAWKNLEFGFESEAQREFAIEEGFFIPDAQKRPYDGDLYIDEFNNWHRFFSVPHVSRGVPYTLGVVHNNSLVTPNGVQLQAYPNVAMHLSRECDGIVSVFRLWVQKSCHLLWVIDTGIDFTSAKERCPPKIVAFDLRTHQIKFQYEIPADQYEPSTVFNAITVVDGPTCRHSQAYVTDARGPGLVVYSLRKNTSWRVYSEYFKADPAYYTTTIAGESFNFIDGLYTVAPVPSKGKLYFHPFASVTEYSVPLYLADFKPIWSFGLNLDPLFKVEGQRPTQSATQAVDSRGQIYFSLMDPLVIQCWNPSTTYTEENFALVAANDVILQFVAGLKARYLPGIGEVLLGTSNRLQKHSTGTVDPNELNYHLFFVNIQDYNC